MYSLLSPAAQAAYSEERFASTYEHVITEAGVIGVAPRLLAAYQPDTHAQVAYVATIQTSLFGDLEVQNQMPLSLVEGRWGVDWSPGLIFPQLVDGAIVRLTKTAPSRGNIYDRNGLGLAVEGELVEVGVVPSQLEDDTALLEQLAVLLDKPPADLRAEYADVDPDWYVPLGRIGAESAEAHYEMLDSAPGVEQRRLWTRSYRPGKVAPHVVGVVGPVRREEVDFWRAQGYSGDEIVGWMGLERWGETYLTGEPGSLLEILTAQGQRVISLAHRSARESSSLYTTFDRHFQKEVQDILGQQAGAIAVLEANTGRVLALATYPTFDPRPFATGISEKEWSDLLDDPWRPLVNRATQGTYPAGSVFKVVTMAAGMEGGGLTADSDFLCEGIWTGLGPDLPKRCWLGSGHGRIPLNRALTVSCDITFYQLGVLLNDLSHDLLPEFARRFGLGAATGIQVEEEAGLVPDPAWKLRTKGEGWATGDAVNLAIGQSELLVTPLQMAAMLSAVGNGGTLYRPSVVEMVASDPDSPDWVFEPSPLAKLPVSPENLSVIQRSLHKVASEPYGTAYRVFGDFGLPVAGKTGTAESGSRDPHAWFVGYAPSSEPEIAIAVVVEHAGQGAEHAAPLFRKVVEAYFRSSGR
jgi:penicillin-binding protein 2